MEGTIDLNKGLWSYWTNTYFSVSIQPKTKVAIYSKDPNKRTGSNKPIGQLIFEK